MRKDDFQPITDAYLARMRDEVASSYDRAAAPFDCPCAPCVDAERMAALRLAASDAISAGCTCWLCLEFAKGGNQ